MKRLLSLLLAAVLALGLMTPAFAASEEAINAADTLYSLGLFSGTGTDANGNPIYDLDRAPTRHEAVTMLVSLLGKKEEALSGTWEMPFTDVADWAKPFVGYAYANGLTAGTSDTTFGGNDLVTAAQYLTFVLKVLGYEAGKDFRWDKAWELSDKIGLTDGSYTAQSKQFLREDVVQISLNAMQLALKGQESRLVQQLAAEGAVDADTAAALGLDAYGWLNGMRLHYDIRTFTVFAFINYTGYDENNGLEITGVRKQLREELNAMNIQISEPDYFTKRGLGREYYVAALTKMGEAPNFRYLETNSIATSLKDLPEKLKEFYEAANIPALYEKYRPQYEKYLSAYQTVGGDIIKMISYFRLDEEMLPQKFAIETNLLDAQGSTIGFGNTEKLYGYGVLRMGLAQSEPNKYGLTFVYAYVAVIHPMVYWMSEQVNALAQYHGAKSGNQWLDLVTEYVSRALAAYVMNDLEMEHLMRRDETASELAYYFYDRLPEFEYFDGDLEEFLKMLMETYPQYR